MIFTEQDKALFAAKGISEEKVLQQLEQFKCGFPFLKLWAAASVENTGVREVQDVQGVQEAWDRYLATGKKVVKFVPASGAASRMFKNLFAFVDGESDVPADDFMKKFFDGIERFPFYDALNDACVVNNGATIDELIEDGDYKSVVSNLLDDCGLGYGKLPKGVLFFHSYDDTVRTPFEEHLAEGAKYAAGKDGKVNIHFTVSPEHRPLFEQLLKDKQEGYEQGFGVKYEISFSEQKQSTDTIAVTPQDEPFRGDDGTILFRPAGHGALIENLNDIDADVVFIKNIDNVVPDSRKGDTVTYKKVLAGMLVTVQEKIFEYVRLLRTRQYGSEQLSEIAEFAEKTLNIRFEDRTWTADMLLQKLQRPLRVCGMVRNVGEPGGGPFFAYNSDGSISLQILESSQIDTANEEYVAMFKNGTHFNPVDLVCALKDCDGKSYDLRQYVDRATGFISSKSKDGRELKALELPGLWNGAMSDWNTVFVEVPLTTFNPVKTVNDLLREQHQ